MMSSEGGSTRQTSLIEVVSTAHSTLASIVDRLSRTVDEHAVELSATKDQLSAIRRWEQDADEIRLVRDLVHVLYTNNERWPSLGLCLTKARKCTADAIRHPWPEFYAMPLPDGLPWVTHAVIRQMSEIQCVGNVAAHRLELRQQAGGPAAQLAGMDEATSFTSHLLNSCGEWPCPLLTTLKALGRTVKTPYP
jgi:outer membrane murein-binding lipoprotein Lpp